MLKPQKYSIESVLASSSSDKIITVENLGKKYRIGHQQAELETAAIPYTALRDVLTDRAKNLFRRNGKKALTSALRSPTSEDFWALKDVSFEVKRGEVVGIIGRNGAGKTTLLKILSRITEPTEGRVRIRGRVASLLEVGTGFHPELTGRENIFLNGAILGMTRAEIKSKFDEIVAFAETETFLDTPVKRYSSGMYVRLAFAVAAHLDPEILVIDEVLAVGDIGFQKKCLGKMEQASRAGRTVLFVSHNMEVISNLTQRSLLLSNGRIVCSGRTREVIANYLRDSSQESRQYRAEISINKPKIVAVDVVTSDPSGVQVHGEPMEVQVEIYTPFPMNGCRIALKASDSIGKKAFYVWAYDSEKPMCRREGFHKVVFNFPAIHLFQGEYKLELHLAEHFGGQRFEKIEGICPFSVAMRNAREGGYEPNEAAYVEQFEWRVYEKRVEGDKTSAV